MVCWCERCGPEFERRGWEMEEGKVPVRGGEESMEGGLWGFGLMNLWCGEMVVVIGGRQRVECWRPRECMREVFAAMGAKTVCKLAKECDD